MSRTMCIVFVLLVCFCVPAFAGTDGGGTGLSVGVLFARDLSATYFNTSLGVSSQKTYNLTFSAGYAYFTSGGASLWMGTAMLNVESKPTKTYFGAGAGALLHSLAGDPTMGSEFGYQIYGGFEFSRTMFCEGKLIGTSGQTMYGISVGNKF